MPYWNFAYTMTVIYTVVKMGGGTGQGPATEVTHLRLNQLPVFPVYTLLQTADLSLNFEYALSLHHVGNKTYVCQTRLKYKVKVSVSNSVNFKWYQDISNTLTIVSRKYAPPLA